MTSHTHVIHVLVEQVLQRAAHGVALGDDALASVVTCARAVGHQRRAADDALESLLQRRARAHFVVAERLHDDLLLQKYKMRSINSCMSLESELRDLEIHPNKHHVAFSNQILFQWKSVFSRSDRFSWLKHGRAFVRKTN